MGMIVRFPRRRHARASAGYKSGRSSCRETPETCSTASTRSGGTSSHCEIACAVIPSGTANLVKPPAALIARSRASLRLVMAKTSSIALPRSQASLHCAHQALLYNVDMTLGKRIKSARERLIPKLTQAEVGDHFGITDKAVSAWERGKDNPELEKLSTLGKILKVPVDWLLAGTGPPPPPDDLQERIEALAPGDRAVVSGLVDSLLVQRRGRVA